jgi:hypothetical protein
MLSTFPNMAQIVTTKEKVSSFALKMNKTINLTLSSRKKLPPMTLPMWRSDRDSLCYFFQFEDTKPLSLKPKSNDLVIGFRTFTNDRHRHGAVKNETISEIHPLIYSGFFTSLRFYWTSSMFFANF